MNDVLLAKRVSIERCIEQIRKYESMPSDLPLSEDYLRQDAIGLNTQRVCELAIDMANHLIRIRKLGVPQSSRESFTILGQEGLIPVELAEAMGRMIGFRNILVHRYQELDFAIFEKVIHSGLDQVLEFSTLALNVPPNPASQPPEATT